MTCCDHDCSAPQTDNRYRRILWIALAVNMVMFCAEIVASIVAGSVSLRADALDFLADAANYAVARRQSCRRRPALSVSRRRQPSYVGLAVHTVTTASQTSP
jgi:hypothetical protein